MLLTRPALRRRWRSIFGRSRFSLILIIVFAILFDALHIILSQPSPRRTSTPTYPAHLKREKVFIASIHRNSEYILRKYWNEALLDLVGLLGRENVFVSVVESGSQEDTKGALRDLETRLKEFGVESEIILLENVKDQVESLKSRKIKEGGVNGELEDGWVWTGREGDRNGGDHGWEKRRIPHLAGLRNLAMEPLSRMDRDGVGRFDRVLWINDVVFSTEDVTTLLSTRDGDYAAACSLDFSGSAEIYYDTFALRDSNGLKTATGTYPYFISPTSLNALLKLQPVPVQSCWNGIIAFDASPFYPTTISKPRISDGKAQDTEILPPLKFRGVSDSLAQEHIEGSECCLIHADNPLRPSKGVYLNPNVRVSYNATTYVKVNPQGPIPSLVLHDPEVIADLAKERKQGKGRRRGAWPEWGEMVGGMWRVRMVRWGVRGRVWSENRIVQGRVRAWEQKWRGIGDSEVEGNGEEKIENGKECLVNEMQVLYGNGWKHI
ncbi:glycosyltransferase family 69 protein [Halenospora varia]|nr:glycosyltransferase family 69 protein [Halenospora varia]